MGYYVLHDSDARRAVIFDSSSERPVNHEAFIGAEAREQGESFLGWLLAMRVPTTDADFYFSSYGTAYPDDPRCYTPQGIDRMLSRWREQCLSEDGDDLNEHGWKYYEALHAVKS